MSCRGRGQGRGRGHHEHPGHPGHPGHHEHHEHQEHHGHRGHHEHHGHRGIPGHRGHLGHHEFGPHTGQMFECKTFPFMEHVEINIPAEVSKPLIQPPIPYVGPITGGIKPGMRLHVVGTVPANAKQFQINFKTGVKDSDDVVFHFNPRFGQCVYMNIFRKGAWQKEELGPDKPFVKGSPFKLLFIINKDNYEVHVNGSHIYTFNHRIPLESVTTLAILGDVLIFWLGFENLTQTVTSTFTIPSEVSNPILQPKIPYVGPITGGIKSGMRLHVEGTVPANAQQFQINFKTGVKDSDDVAFHFNPRFGQCVYMNIFRKGAWQKEELGPVTPFVKGSNFKLLFIINKDNYEVHVNGTPLYRFNHRIPIESVTTLAVLGDVLIYWMGFEKWAAASLFKESKVILMRIGLQAFIPLEVYYPITNPAIPYVGQIPGGIKKDFGVVFQGTVPADSKGFEINFKTGPAEGDDIAFHYNPCIPDKPLTRGGGFIILFIIKAEGYEVYVNGFKHCTFKHRIPLEKVSTLNICGNVSIHVCGFIDGWSTTSTFTELKKITATQTSTSCGTSMPFEISHSISNPKLPYVGKIPGGFKQDMAVFLQGTLPAEAKSFEMNFKTGTSDADDTAFHYNPRIGDRTALNCCRSGSWETEESATDKPFTKGGVFQIFVAIKSDGYEVYTNGLKHCTFKHRIPLEKVSAITFNGDISSLLCGFIQKWTCPSLFIKEKRSVLMGSGSGKGIPLEISNPVSNPAVPYVSEIPGGIKQDLAVVFQGTVPADAKSFEINFKTGPADGHDIAFHYKPVIGEHTALNSFRNGSWETVETATDEPFRFGGNFIILFIITANGYEVYVNGLKHCTFKHRIPLDKVSTFNVRGDVSLHVCGLINNWSTTSSFSELKKSTGTWSSASGFKSLPLEISQPVVNPALPYVGKIPGGINKDMALFFQGSVPTDAKGFDINFKTGPGDSDDIAFQYNPRFGDHTSLNSFRAGKWDQEENAPDKPFTKGEAFQMIIVINSDGYEVYVNGLRHCTFKHRIPLEKVSTLRINGHVSPLICGFIHSWSTSSFFTKLQKIVITECSPTIVECAPLQISHPISNPALPYVGEIPGGLKQDMAVFFQGSVLPDGKSFYINFKTGEGEGDDIAFHFNPRMGYTTALNSFRNGGWGTQEDAPDKPFTKGGAFQMIIVINSEGYEVYVNGLRHCTFKHRIPLEKVSTLHINGQVSLLVCGFIHSWSTSSFFTKLQEVVMTESSQIMESGSLEISHAISNTALPYAGEIPGGLKQDMAVFFQGSVLPDGESFYINFKTGRGEGDDIAFHFSPRMGYTTALNSFRNGGWDTQEDAPDKPFTKGGAFQMIIVINSEGYEVYVNGLRHCVFKHRLPLEKVLALAIDGHILLSICGFVYNWSTSSMCTEIMKFQSTQSSTTTTVTLQVSQPISNPVIPFEGKIPIKVKQDMAVLFQGNVLENGNSFIIDFTTESKDIAFHYNPRIGNLTALNNLRNGNWDTQENAPDKPFAKGQAFQIIVVFKSEGYEVYANNMRHCTYKHRIPLENVSGISVQRDVALQLIGFIENWKSE